MKLVITGCNGSVGQRVVLLALKRGYTVTGGDYATLSEELRSLVQDYQERFTYHQYDLKDYDRVLELLKNSKCEAVIHLAAIRDPSDYKVHTHNSNVVLSWNVLRACAELGITRIAQASSVNVITMVYSAKPILKYFPIDENHPCEPDEPYGLSKVMCELQADTITRRYPNLRIASLRLHWSVPSRAYTLRRDAKDATKDLWGWIFHDSTADAFLLAVTCDTTKWSSKHEAMFVAAPDIARDEDSAKLKAEYYPEVPIREGFEISGTKGFFDCRKAERVIGWVHRTVVPE
ncbi:dTDP-6-deoxy-L-talose 4-dehydrogenase (NAD(+)) [Leucoagaricus sp. SymC.cos]|nr:dTDP-6-deoxy-L-talose 4-dehydrogenase (NAD(+)) [Leucoagaricus sp. SymC.cos]